MLKVDGKHQHSKSIKHHSHTYDNHRITYQLTLWQNFLQTGRISLSNVAEYIITCFSYGVTLKIDWTSLRISISARRRSHSSSTKCFTLDRSRAFLLVARSRTRPGVPTTIWGTSTFNASMSVLTLIPVDGWVRWWVGTSVWRGEWAGESSWQQQYQR